jgi:DNA-binding transcriptional LysR family regulator
VALEHLASEPFILRERGSGTRIVTFQALEGAGFDPSRLKPVAEMGSTEAIRQGIKAGIGVSVLSAQAVAEDVERKTLVAVPLEGLRIHRPFYLALRRNRRSSPLCAAFIAHLQARA